MANKKKNYSIEDCYEKLYSVLESLGLTYEDIKKEFEAPRSKQVNTKGFTFAHGRVLSTPTKIIPERIQNGSYASDTPSLKAWFERQFRNSSIFEHLGDYDVIENLKNDSDIQFNAINGNLFLYEDGNHRLFNYLLLAIMDQKASLSGKEINESRERFTLHNKPVHFEHPVSLIHAFDKYTKQTFDPLSQNVKNYFFETIQNTDIQEVGQSDYLTFNPSTKTYNLCIDGKTYFNLSAEKATEIIESQPELPNGVKIWKVNNTFYLSINNNIFKTDDNKFFSETVKKQFNHLPTLSSPYQEDYLVINDLDDPDNSSTIRTTPKNYSIYNNPELSTENIIKFKDYLKQNFNAINSHLTRKEISLIEDIINSESDTSIDIPALEFYGLDDENVDELEDILIKGLHILNPDKKKEYEQGEEE